jgi:hypothetical protein
MSFFGTKQISQVNPKAYEEWLYTTQYKTDIDSLEKYLKQFNFNKDVYNQKITCLLTGHDELYGRITQLINSSNLSNDDKLKMHTRLGTVIPKLQENCKDAKRASHLTTGNCKFKDTDVCINLKELQGIYNIVRGLQPTADQIAAAERAAANAAAERAAANAAAERAAANAAAERAAANAAKAATKESTNQKSNVIAKIDKSIAEINSMLKIIKAPKNTNVIPKGIVQKGINFFSKGGTRKRRNKKRANKSRRGRKTLNNR